ncbi:MAG TPA: DNRLRE domain-containing protein, partial [Polyangiaceae bacterium]
LAVLASASVGSHAASKGAVPEVIALGRADTGSLVVLMRFVATWRADADVDGAFLTMEPLEGAPPARVSTPIEIARVLEPWSSETATWGRQPRLGVPEVAAFVPGHPAQRLRVDVTAIVRAWPRHAHDEHGIALLARGDDPFGSVFTTGVADGVGPRLEVYVR